MASLGKHLNVIFSHIFFSFYLVLKMYEKLRKVFLLSQFNMRENPQLIIAIHTEGDSRHQIAGRI